MAIIYAQIVVCSLSFAARLDPARVTTPRSDLHWLAPACPMARFGDRATTVCADYDVANARIHVIDAVLR